MATGRGGSIQNPRAIDYYTVSLVLAGITGIPDSIHFLENGGGAFWGMNDNIHMAKNPDIKPDIDF